MARTIPFWKYQSIGNDFPLVHIDDAVDAFGNDLEPMLQKLAISMADRRFGVGGDGLLVMRGNIDEPNGSFPLWMFNPDGTEDFCGNGLRCAAIHAHTHLGAGASFELLHGGRLIPTTLQDQVVRTRLGAASYHRGDVPLVPSSGEIFRGPVYWDETRTIIGSALTTGSTHVVIPTEQLPSRIEIETLGPLIEHFELYPARTSVIWSKVVAEDRLDIRIWERGVGETFGCGTGSSAAAADYLRAQGRGGAVLVVNPGGDVTVTAESWDAPIEVEGTAALTFEGEFLVTAA